MSLKRLIQEAKQRASVLPTGYAALDEALGIGGYPKGRIVEMISADLGVSAAVAMRSMASIQERRPGATSHVAWIDDQQIFDPGVARSMGVDLGRMILSQPPDTSEAFDSLDRLLMTSQFDLIVAVVGNKRMSKSAVSPAESRRFWRRLTPRALRVGTTILILTRPESPIDPTPISNVLKFYASVRIKLKPVDAEQGIYAATVIKNKLAVPFRTAEIKL